MNLPEATDILRQHQQWRRGDDEVKPVKPVFLTHAIDIILEHLGNE